jgi:hypothetical protein
MFDEQSITPGLAELGYLRLKKLTYKAPWSLTDVEHFLFFSLYGGGEESCGLASSRSRGQPAIDWRPAYAQFAIFLQDKPPSNTLRRVRLRLRAKSRSAVPRSGLQRIP